MQAEMYYPIWLLGIVFLRCMLKARSKTLWLSYSFSSKYSCFPNPLFFINLLKKIIWWIIFFVYAALKKMSMKKNCMTTTEFCSRHSTYTWEKQYPKARLGKTQIQVWQQKIWNCNYKKKMSMKTKSSYLIHFGLHSPSVLYSGTCISLSFHYHFTVSSVCTHYYGHGNVTSYFPLP
jgi:hypothetical protein